MTRHDPEVDAVRKARQEGQANKAQPAPSPELQQAVRHAQEAMDRRHRRDASDDEAQ